jgi:hypothetical protein
MSLSSLLQGPTVAEASREIQREPVLLHGGFSSMASKTILTFASVRVVYPLILARWSDSSSSQNTHTSIIQVSRLHIFHHNIIASTGHFLSYVTTLIHQLCVEKRKCLTTIKTLTAAHNIQVVWLRIKKKIHLHLRALIKYTCICNK